MRDNELSYINTIIFTNLWFNRSLLSNFLLDSGAAMSVIIKLDAIGSEH